MFGFIISGVAGAFSVMNRYLPGPWLSRRILHRRDGHKWGVPSMLLSAPYFLVANIFKGLLVGGGSAWLGVPLLWCLVMGIAFLAMGPLSLALLMKAKIAEAISRKRAATSSDA